MKAKEFRSMAESQLLDLLMTLGRERFNLQIQKSTGQLVKSHRFEGIRKDIARIKTVLSEKGSML